MKRRLRFAARALADIEGIGDHIAAGGHATRARTFTAELRARCARLVDFPEAAPQRPEFGAGVRAVPFGRFLILYRWQAERGVVRVSRVVGAAQRPRPVA